jgi:hypothetical protein
MILEDALNLLEEFLAPLLAKLDFSTEGASTRWNTTYPTFAVHRFQ